MNIPSTEVTTTFNDRDHAKLLLLERDTWRALALVMYAKEEAMLPLPLQKTKCSRKGGGSWVCIPETFGDMLCETAQCIATGRCW